MHVYVVFAHPSKQSFSHCVMQAFTRGLAEAGHSVEVADLYGMGFRSERGEDQYLREVSVKPAAPVPDDVYNRGQIP